LFIILHKITTIAVQSLCDCGDIASYCVVSAHRYTFYYMLFNVASTIWKASDPGLSIMYTTFILKYIHLLLLIYLCLSSLLPPLLSSFLFALERMPVPLHCT